MSTDEISSVAAGSLLLMSIGRLTRARVESLWPEMPVTDVVEGPHVILWRLS